MTRKKKLLRVTTSDISLNALIKGQLKFMNQYYDVVALSNNTGLLDKVAQREGVRTIEVPMKREISLKDDIKCLFQLIRVFKKERPFIVHANTPKGSLLSMAAAWLCRVPHRIYLVTGLRYQGATGLFRFLLMSMERLSCFFANKVIPEGQGVLHALQADHITGKPLQIVLNGNINGIDTAFFSKEATIKYLRQLPMDNDLGGLKDISSSEATRLSLRKHLDISDNDYLFVFIGRIVKDKGMKELVGSLKALSDDKTLVDKIKCPKVLLVGTFEDGDPLDPEDENFLRESENVKLVGWQSDVRPFILAADALVFPSYREGFPNAPMQAGAMEIPSIVTDINGCNEIIKDGLNGKIIQPRNTAALTNAMKWLLTHEEEGRRMAKNARKMIQDRYEQERVWNALLETYRNL